MRERRAYVLELAANPEPAEAHEAAPQRSVGHHLQRLDLRQWAQIQRHQAPERERRQPRGEPARRLGLGVDLFVHDTARCDFALARRSLLR
jgi:hypothetical protein